MAKFGIDSNYVFDKDEKSVAARLAEHDDLFDDHVLQLATKAKLKGTLNLDDYDSYKIAAAYGYDYQPAMQKACDDLISKYSGGILIIPPGTFDRYSTYSLPNNVTIMGTGYYQTVLNSKTDTPAITLNDNCALMNIKVVNTFSTIRGTSNLNAAILVYGDKVLVENVWVSGSKTVGIMVSTASDVIINKCLVENTLADGIHITDNSQNVIVTNCTVRESGDDSFAVVSYQNQTNPCKNIFIVNNYSYHSKSRGAVVVGGYNVTIQGNRIDTPTNAGIYIAQETAYSTLGTDQVDIFDNKIFNANSYNQTTNYGSIHISCQDINYPVTNIKIVRNKAINSRWRGISLGGTGTVTNLLQNILIKDNEILGNTIESGIAFSNTQDLRIEDNTLKNIAGSGMYDNLYCTGVLSIKRNRLENVNTSQATFMYGIIVRSNTLSLANVIDNTVIDNSVTLNKVIQITNGTPFIYERNVYPGTFKTVNVTDLTTLVPVYVGQTYIKNGFVYMATGTTATTDWKQLN
jgi:parallel beta-helix repeat protein